MRTTPPLALGLLAFALASSSGCEGEEKKPQFSAWSTVKAAFDGKALFDAGARQRHFSPEAIDSLALPSLISPERYAFLYIDDVHRVDAGTRKGKVAFSVDEWPMSLGITLSKTPEGPWKITGVDDPALQRRRLALIGEDGLPAAPTARPWRGGLAARDAVGRPTASVLVLVEPDRVEVDGIPVPKDDRAAHVQAIRDAVARRTRLANDAHAGYTPQVAIAMARRAPAAQLASFAAIAREAEVEEVLLVVRGPGGRPALYPLARITNAEGNVPPPVIEARESEAGLSLTLGEQVVQIPRKGPVIDRDQLRLTMDQMLEAEATPVGVRLYPWASGEHRHTVAVLDAIRASAPGFPILVEGP